MQLTNVAGSWGYFDRRLGLYCYAGLSEWNNNEGSATTDRQIADNVDLLRSRAPFAYLIENEPLEVLQKRWSLPKNTERAYYKALPKIQLRRGGWFGAPFFEGPAETTVMAVGQGDVYPFISQIHDDWHQILCLPTLESVETIDEIVCSSASTADALVKLLAGGGFLLTYIHFRVFDIVTMDKGYEVFFPNATRPVWRE